jgi:nicotinamidase-related amidase
MAGPDPRALLGDPARTALLVVDMQNDFLVPPAPLATPRGLEIVPVVAALADAARRQGLPVVYTQEQHRDDESDFGIELHFEPPHCLEGTPGADIVDGLTPRPGDVLIRRKRRYDAFLGTDLELWLHANRVENLIVTGVCTDICVISTVQHARNADFRCFVVSDGVDGTSRERHQAALLCMSHVFAYVGTARELAALFGLDVGLPGPSVGVAEVATDRTAVSADVGH